MTVEAVAAHEAFHHRILEVARTLTEAEQIAPSACAGWRVRDVVAHIGAGARNLIDPLPVPDERLPLPSVREREHDVHVDIRRSWPMAEVVEELDHYGAERLARLSALQEEPLASAPLEVPGLGTYPMHAAANGLAFDCFCHLYHDIAAPGGPVQRELPAPAHEELYPVVQWMMWGLPQMQGPELDESLIAPITICLTGPGESIWTVRRPDPDGGLVVEEAGGGDAAVTSAAFDFVSWGTARTPWRAACEIDGDAGLASGFLSTLNIV
ncbi:MAG: maleylpyruvate isomerase N-terminal domain-containing protein [bacterium]|nr:maleylpyruvate isomerase N-terminal domain-containing protein [bacterium]MCY4273309.1 maleylpyruvate isomerase N-terminal domain-containing protein [bacterium]